MRIKFIFILLFNLVRFYSSFSQDISYPCLGGNFERTGHLQVNGSDVEVKLGGCYLNWVSPTYLENQDWQSIVAPTSTNTWNKADALEASSRALIYTGGIVNTQTKEENYFYNETSEEENYLQWEFKSGTFEIVKGEYYELFVAIPTGPTYIDSVPLIPQNSFVYEIEGVEQLDETDSNLPLKINFNTTQINGGWVNIGAAFKAKSNTITLRLSSKKIGTQRSVVYAANAMIRRVSGEYSGAPIVGQNLKVDSDDGSSTATTRVFTVKNEWSTTTTEPFIYGRVNSFAADGTKDRTNNPSGISKIHWSWPEDSSYFSSDLSSTKKLTILGTPVYHNLNNAPYVVVCREDGTVITLNAKDNLSTGENRKIWEYNLQENVSFGDFSPIIISSSSTAYMFVINREGTYALINLVNGDIKYSSSETQKFINSPTLIHIEGKQYIIGVRKDLKVVLLSVEKMLNNQNPEVATYPYTSAAFDSVSLGIYVSIQNLYVFGDDRGVLHALKIDEETLNEKWTFKSDPLNSEEPEKFSSFSLVSGTTLPKEISTFSSDHLLWVDEKGKIYCLDLETNLETGKLNWKTEGKIEEVPSAPLLLATLAPTSVESESRLSADYVPMVLMATKSGELLGYYVKDLNTSIKPIVEDEPRLLRQITPYDILKRSASEIKGLAVGALDHSSNANPDWLYITDGLGNLYGFNVDFNSPFSKKQAENERNRNRSLNEDLNNIKSFMAANPQLKFTTPTKAFELQTSILTFEELNNTQYFKNADEVRPFEFGEYVQFVIYVEPQDQKVIAPASLRINPYINSTGITSKRRYEVKENNVFKGYAYLFQLFTDCTIAPSTFKVGTNPLKVLMGTRTLPTGPAFNIKLAHPLGLAVEDSTASQDSSVNVGCFWDISKFYDKNNEDEAFEEEKAEVLENGTLPKKMIKDEEEKENPFRFEVYIRNLIHGKIREEKIYLYDRSLMSRIKRGFLEVQLFPYEDLKFNYVTDLALDAYTYFPNEKQADYPDIPAHKIQFNREMKSGNGNPLINSVELYPPDLQIEENKYKDKSYFDGWKRELRPTPFSIKINTPLYQPPGVRDYFLKDLTFSVFPKEKNNQKMSSKANPKDYAFRVFDLYANVEIDRRIKINKSVFQWNRYPTGINIQKNLGYPHQELTLQNVGNVNLKGVKLKDDIFLKSGLEESNDLPKTKVGEVPETKEVTLALQIPLGTPVGEKSMDYFIEADKTYSLELIDPSGMDSVPKEVDDANIEGSKFKSVFEVIENQATNTVRQEGDLHKGIPSLAPMIEEGKDPKSLVSNVQPGLKKSEGVLHVAWVSDRETRDQNNKNWGIYLSEVNFKNPVLSSNQWFAKPKKIICPQPNELFGKNVFNLPGKYSNPVFGEKRIYFTAEAQDQSGKNYSGLFSTDIQGQNLKIIDKEESTIKGRPSISENYVCYSVGGHTGSEIRVHDLLKGSLKIFLPSCLNSISHLSCVLNNKKLSIAFSAKCEGRTKQEILLGCYDPSTGQWEPQFKELAMTKDPVTGIHWLPALNFDDSKPLTLIINGEPIQIKSNTKFRIGKEGIGLFDAERGCLQLKNVLIKSSAQIKVKGYYKLSRPFFKISKEEDIVFPCLIKGDDKLLLSAIKGNGGLFSSIQKDGKVSDPKVIPCFNKNISTGLTMEFLRKNEVCLFWSSTQNGAPDLFFEVWEYRK